MVVGKFYVFYDCVDQLCIWVIKWVNLKWLVKVEKKLVIMVFSFFFDKGNVGIVVYLNVFLFIYSVLKELKVDGYNVEGFFELLEVFIEEVIYDKEVWFSSFDLNIVYKMLIWEYYQLIFYVKVLEESWGKVLGILNLDG